MTTSELGTILSIESIIISPYKENSEIERGFPPAHKFCPLNSTKRGEDKEL